MLKQALSAIFIFSSTLTSFCQQADSISIAEKNNNPQTDNQAQEQNLKPTIGIGTGLFSYYGDLYQKKLVNPQVSRIGFELSLTQDLTSFLDINFYALFGKLGANERTEIRNENFQSEIRVGGVQLMYNFDNLFSKKDRIISPYISSGFESFEFLSKTDLYDINGFRYHYWSDGSIRSLAENDPIAPVAVVLQRDYKYESDIRELNSDGFGKYQERSFAIPVGIGAVMHLSKSVNLKIGSTLHFTFTDYIDGITKDSKGSRIGNSKNDNFLMTSFSLHYKIGSNKKESDTLSEDHFKDVDFFALDKEDRDKDGVPDPDDLCPGTPLSVTVDEKGCPLDGDKDGVADYLDQELTTPVGSLVDDKGIQLTDSMIALQYQMYMDSTGQFAKVEILESRKGTSRPATGSQGNYTVKLGEYQKGLPPELMSKFLSIPDIESTTINDSTTVYTAGKYSSVTEAEKRKEEFIKNGIATATVMEKKGGNLINPIATITTTEKKTTEEIVKTDPKPTEKTDSIAVNNTDPKITEGTQKETIPSTAAVEGVVFRVQLGAYKKKISKSVFGIDDVITLQTEDGLYKYLAGSYKSFDDAAKRKVDMLLKGFPDAFVVAYKDGKRVPLTSVGATVAKKEPEENLQNSEQELNSADKKLVVFKVQVGVFKSEPPADVLEKFNSIKGIKKETTPAGLTRYTVGALNDYKAIQELKNELKAKGLTDAFVIAFFNDQYITIQEALELQK